MAEASPPRKPATLEPAPLVPSVRVALTPTRAPKKRRVRRKSMREDEIKEQETIATARQRFVQDSEDEEPTATPLRFVTLPPKLVTSKSEGRANALPSRRRQLPQQTFQPKRPALPATRQPLGQRTDSKLVQRY
ncbi:hypothetical protein PHMEG_00028646, partial [Phytophthora megakarya]